MQDPYIINGAMVRHLGQSKPADATQTAQTSFHRNYDLISLGLPDEKLLYGRAKIAERKLTARCCCGCLFFLHSCSPIGFFHK